MQGVPGGGLTQVVLGPWLRHGRGGCAQAGGQGLAQAVVVGWGVLLHALHAGRARRVAARLWPQPLEQTCRGPLIRRCRRSRAPGRRMQWEPVRMWCRQMSQSDAAADHAAGECRADGHGPNSCAMAMLTSSTEE